MVNIQYKKKYLKLKIQTYLNLTHNKGNENKFISGGRYYIPTLDKFGTYDGNTRQFTIVE
jgi:hypothetical protein